MGLETGTTLEALNSSWPLSSDSRIQGDDHIRLIKAALKSTFPGVNGSGFSIPIAATEAELNYVDGVTGPIQGQLDSKAPLVSPILTGTPVAPNPALGNNSTQIATTYFVRQQVAADVAAMRLAAKVWLKAGTTGNILNSYGVASVVDTGTGVITVNFSVPFTGDYSCLVSLDSASTKFPRVVVNSTSQVTLYCTYLSDGLHQTFDLVDPVGWNLVVFGDQ